MESFLKVGGMAVALLVALLAAKDIYQYRQTLPAQLPDGTLVTLEVASSPAARAKGLMYRDSFPRTQGMLFIFDQPGRYGFWMKNVTVPLDIIFLDDNGRIQECISAPTCESGACAVYRPRQPSGRVIELLTQQCAGMEAGRMIVIRQPL